MREPMFAAMLGIWEIIIILTVVAVTAASVLAVVLVVLWLARRSQTKASSSASSPPGCCSRCGTIMPPNSPAGLCPRCVLSVGLETQTELGTASGPNGTQVSKLPPPAPDEIAKLFPHLEILDCLGRGGMGAVYKARQTKLDRLVALKILTPERQTDAQFRERFEREARTLARLSHPNIVAVYDYGETSGYCYLLMEFVDGVTLRQLLRTRKLSPEEAVGIVPKVCEALEFAHGKGVVHRDIKPENILLDRTGQLKIADFGIAKILQPGMQDFSITGAKDVIGTPHYMAPEQVEEPTKVDHRADIFSLGVVFYEMLTGELPLGKFAPPSRKVQVDVRLDEIVLHALEKEPARRYQHASEVRTDVETVATTAQREPELMLPVAKGADSRRAEAGELQRSVPVVVARWAARIGGTLLLLLFGTFILAEGLPAIFTQPGGVQLNFVALGLMLGGFVVGWKRDGSAALLIASGWTLWHVSEGRFQWSLFQIPLLVATLHAYCWWTAHSRKTGIVVATILALAVVFVAGRLLLPVNVFLQGVIADVATGDPISGATVAFVPKGSNNFNSTALPSARADTDGRFRLYVGWYDSRNEVTISAPGYVALTTNLGPRVLGRRSMHRDFQLQPVQPAAQDNFVPPPVVVRTVPESGTANVDPQLTELRVTFSKPMRDRSWSWVDLNDGTFPELVGQPHYLEDGRTCVLPVKLEPGRVYATWINTDHFSNFKDTDGNAAAPYLLIFETRK